MKIVHSQTELGEKVEERERENIWHWEFGDILFCPWQFRFTLSLFIRVASCELRVASECIAEEKQHRRCTFSRFPFPPPHSQPLNAHLGLSFPLVLLFHLPPPLHSISLSTLLSRLQLPKPLNTFTSLLSTPPLVS